MRVQENNHKRPSAATPSAPDKVVTEEATKQMEPSPSVLKWNEINDQLEQVNRHL